MTNQDKLEFKQLIVEGTVEALKSEESRQVIKEGTLEALNSDQGKHVIKESALDALRSDEGKNIVLDVFVEAFHDVVVPVIEKLHEDHEKRIIILEEKAGVNL